MPPRHTGAWYREMVLICTVFAVTGSSTMVLVRALCALCALCVCVCVADFVF
jgi:hypothetical protein